MLRNVWIKDTSSVILLSNFSQNIEGLDLSENPISKKGCFLVSSFVKDLKNLKTLQMQGISMRVQGVKYVCSNLTFKKGFCCLFAKGIQFISDCTHVSKSGSGDSLGY